MQRISSISFQLTQSKMQFISNSLLFAFVGSVLVEFALLQYVGPSFPPQLELQSNYLNEQIPDTGNEALVETTVAPLEAPANKRLTRGIDRI